MPTWTPGAQYGDNLTALNKFMKDYPLDGIEPAVKHNNMLLERLGSVADHESFIGKQAILELETRVPATGAVVAEGEDVPLPGEHGFEQMLLTTRRVYATAGATDEAIEAAKGGPNSFGVYVDRAIRNCRSDMNLTLKRIYAGDGTGRLARCAGAPVRVNNFEFTLTVDNNRANFGWAGTKWLRVGMTVEFHASKLSNGVPVHDSTATVARAMTAIASRGCCLAASSVGGGLSIRTTMSAWASWLPPLRRSWSLGPLSCPDLFSEFRFNWLATTTGTFTLLARSLRATTTLSMSRS